MRSSIAILCLLVVTLAFAEPTASPNPSNPSFTTSAWNRVKQVWYEGDTELYLSGYAWHNRYTYSRERLATYNEAAWGGGLGKSLYDENGNWHGLYAFAFLDSHKDLEPIAGYAYAKVYHFDKHVGVGGGLTAFITSRSDILNRIPCPGILPYAFLTIGRATLSATYIPGASGAGNVLYITGKWRI